MTKEKYFKQFKEDLEKKNINISIDYRTGNFKVINGLNRFLSLTTYYEIGLKHILGYDYFNYLDNKKYEYRLIQNLGSMNLDDLV